MFCKKIKVAKGHEEGEIRVLNELFKKGDKVVKETKTVQVFNGYYWANVPVFTRARTWDEAGEYFKYDNDSSIDD